MRFDFFLDKTAIVSCLIVALFGVSIFKSSNKSIRAFTGLMISHFVFQVFAFQIYMLMGENTLYYKLSKLIYILFEYFFFLYLIPIKKYRRIISLFFSLGVITLIVHYFDSFSNPNNLAKTMIIDNFMVLISCFLFYIYLMKNISMKPLLSQWQFLMVTGFFMYSLTSTGALLIDVYATEIGLASRQMRIMNTVMYILELCIFFWGLWVYHAELKNNQKLKLENRTID